VIKSQAPTTPYGVPSIQEKVLKELSANLAALMSVENLGINNSDGNCPTFFHKPDTLQVKPSILVKQTD